MPRGLVTLALFLAPASLGAATAPRTVRISGQQFVLSATNKTIVLSGPNVVVKGPPYLPSVAGDDFCVDVVNDACAAAGNCSTCATFNQADVDHIKAMGWNSIRLGVTWAGAQPRDEDALDAAFVARLHDLLDLTDANGLHVVLDNHGDMVGSAGCGNGVPMWFQQAAAPELIGAPLATGLPYSLVPSLRVADLGGYDHCGDDTGMWAKYAGDPNYNLLNECCQAMNSGNPAPLGYTTISQATMDYMVEEGAGRDAFVRYWRLVAEAVADHPSAIAAELMNEPMSIRRRAMFETWRATAEAINAVVPDMSVALADTGEGAVLPSWVSRIFGAGVAISRDTVEWIRASSTLFYAWHWYGDPESTDDTIKNVQAISADWDVPSFATEFMSCDIWNGAAAAGISHSYWHYSAYCNTGPDFGDRAVPGDTFGACILGWAGGDSSKTCD